MHWAATLTLHELRLPAARQRIAAKLAVVKGGTWPAARVRRGTRELTLEAMPWADKVSLR